MIYSDLASKSKRGVFFMFTSKEIKKKAIHGDAETYEREFAEIMQDLADRGLDVDVNEAIDPAAEMPFACTITWVEETHIPDNIQDRYQLKGYKDICQHCPHFTQKDRRRKTGLCDFFDREVTRTQRCCDHYFLCYVENAD